MSTQTKAGDGGRSAAGWSELPDDLLDMVRSRIVCPHDRVRFAAVCRSWRAAASQQPAPALAPVLFLSLYNVLDKIDQYLCGPDGSWVFRRLSKAANKRFVGSHDGGWIALVTDYRLLITNIFSGAEVALSEEQSDINSVCSLGHLQKLIFSGNPTSPNGCILGAIIEGQPYITRCIVGCQDSRWTTSDWDWEWIKDIAFCNGELYGLTRGSDEVIKFVIGNEKGSTPIMFTAIYRLSIQRHNRPSTNYSKKLYVRLVSYIFQLHGKLAMAVRTRWLPHLDPFFKIFELIDVDAGEKYKHKWIEVRSLDDYALFIGATESKAVHVPMISAKHPGLERNHIYYIEYPYTWTQGKLPDNVVYSMTSVDGGDFTMYCKKDQTLRDGMKRTGYYVRGCWNYAMWVNPPDL